MTKQLKKYILLTLGIFFVMLGVIGAVLPILPTTPFLILALACFAKSSPRFHLMLLNNRWFGDDLQQWEQSHTVSHSAKNKAILLIIISFLISISILHGRLQLQLGLLVLGCILLFFIYRLKESPEAA